MMYQVEDQLEGIMLDLLNLKRNPGQNEQQFIASYSHEQRKVGDIQLKVAAPPLDDWKEDRQLNQLIDDTISYIDKR